MPVDSILNAIEKPLIFASKNNFSNLLHIKNLGKTIVTLSDKGIYEIKNVNYADLFIKLKNKFCTFETLDESAKKAVITQSLSIIKQLRETSATTETKTAEPTSLYESHRLLRSPIQFVKGVGPKLSEIFSRKGVTTIEDALCFLPRSYFDHRKLKRIADLKSGEEATIIGVIISTGSAKTLSRRHIFEITVDDGSQILIAKWFNYSLQYQNMLKNKLKKGEKVILSGRVADFRFQKEIHHPDLEVITDDEDLGSDYQKIIPIYPLSEGLHQKTVRKIMKNVSETYAPVVADALPESIRHDYALVPIQEAFKKVHFPDNSDNFNALINFQSVYHRRLVFDEFFFLELGLAMKKKGVSLMPGVTFQVPQERVSPFISSLPFSLTTAQQRTLQEILSDMQKPYPMNRLVQGDVGSGKTVVALIASLVAVWNGFQSAFMAPTEILAEQHHATIKALIKNIDIKIVVLTSSQSKSQKDSVLERILIGEAHLIIGTHAIIQESVEFHNLGFVVIDEQHKFGVMQRAQLKKKGVTPDVLVMTATPIPRTLGLTVYGDLDLSIIDELPPGRIPVVTKVYHEKNREEVYELVHRELKKGSQTFIVYPLVEESEKVDLKDATKMAHHLQQDIFPQYRVGLIHGKMPAAEKEIIMQQFQSGAINILVATTVIEVGIDIPNASLMIIEHAERFGLSQLHQLRGRVGRGKSRSMCILLAQYRKSDDARRRLAVMERTTDGFKIAEEDFNIRGPGEFLGTRQSGLPDFRVANILRDVKILQEARQAAFDLAASDPELKAEEHQLIKKVLVDRWKGRLELAGIG